ncbi:DotU family type IV/VI secretion system protein, partial [Photobacterium damselae]
MDETLDREKATKQAEGYFDGVLFDNAKNINQDQDFWFKLRGNNINALIDAATPLLGMSLRIRNLSHCDNIDEIYHQSVEEIKAIEVELTEAGYEHAVILAYRYVLCSFIDEAVMSTPWAQIV